MKNKNLHFYQSERLSVSIIYFFSSVSFHIDFQFNLTEQKKKFQITLCYFENNVNIYLLKTKKNVG
jgi:hypothetical protein